jgi:hypothetical protein
MGDAMTEADILKVLRTRFGPPTYAFLSHVRNGTGFARTTVRTADALAMGLWPSRGVELHGFEVKVSRGDWLHELKQPEKAEEIGRYCDRWWIAAPKGVVDVAEIPPAWGLITLDGGKTKFAKPAEKLDPKPMDRLMLAAILRGACESMPAPALLATERAEGHREGVLAGELSAQQDIAEAKDALQKFRKFVNDFEKASGLSLSNRWDYEGREIGEAVYRVLHGEDKKIERRLADLRAHAAQILEGIDKEIAKKEEPNGPRPDPQRRDRVHTQALDRSGRRAPGDRGVPFWSAGEADAACARVGGA